MRAQTAAATAVTLVASMAVPGQADEPSNGSAGDVPQAYVEEARGLAKDFVTELESELKAAIAKGGPVNAIDVCGNIAPSIASSLAEQSGWVVSRTALKVRNPRNAPSVRERAVLMTFEQRHAQGEPYEKMENATVIEQGDRRYLHYMKAIPAKDACMACHGSEVSTPVKKAIAEQYPADAATGFEVGDLRGAFTFVRPLPSR